MDFDSLKSLTQSIAQALSLVVRDMTVIGTEGSHTPRVSVCLIDAFSLLSHAMESAIREHALRHGPVPTEPGPMIQTQSYNSQTVSIAFECLAGAISAVIRGLLRGDQAQTEAMGIFASALSTYAGQCVSETQYGSVDPVEIVRAVAAALQKPWPEPGEEGDPASLTLEAESALYCLGEFINASLRSIMQAQGMGLNESDAIARLATGVSYELFDELRSCLAWIPWWPFDEECPVFEEAEGAELVRDALVAISPSISHVAALLMHARGDCPETCMYASHFAQVLSAVHETYNPGDVTHASIFDEVTAVIRNIAQCTQAVSEQHTDWPLATTQQDGLFGPMELRNERADMHAQIDTLLSGAGPRNMSAIALIAINARLVPWPQPNFLLPTPVPLFGDIDGDFKSMRVQLKETGIQERVVVAKSTRLFVSFCVPFTRVAIRVSTMEEVDNDELDLEGMRSEAVQVMTDNELENINTYGAVLIPVDMLASKLPSTVLIPEAVWSSPGMDWEQTECLDNVFSADEMALLTRRVVAKVDADDTLKMIPESSAEDFRTDGFELERTSLGQCHADIVFCVKVDLSVVNCSVAFRDQTCHGIIKSMEEWLASRVSVCEYLPTNIDFDTEAALTLFRNSLPNMTNDSAFMADTWSRGLKLLLELAWGPYDSLTLLNIICHAAGHTLPTLEDTSSSEQVAAPQPVGTYGTDDSADEDDEEQDEPQSPWALFPRAVWPPPPPDGGFGDEGDDSTHWDEQDIDAL